ncbi:MAG: protease [Planctomycetota bacterium]|nr:MAG: protease [Planctomycetota bacterium]
MAELSGRRVLVFVGDDYEDLELWYPKLRLEEAGAQVVVAGQAARHMYRGKHGYPCESDAAVRDVAAQEFDGVVVPGGWMPDKLRRDADVLALVRAFNEAGKMIASICHGAWINISAGVVKGVTMTSTPGIRDDLTNAGAMWVDKPVVVDRHHISSRRPPDLPQFGAAIVAYLAGHGR